MKEKEKKWTNLKRIILLSLVFSIFSIDVMGGSDKYYQRIVKIGAYNDPSTTVGPADGCNVYAEVEQTSSPSQGGKLGSYSSPLSITVKGGTYADTDPDTKEFPIFLFFNSTIGQSTGYNVNSNRCFKGWSFNVGGEDIFSNDMSVYLGNYVFKKEKDDSDVTKVYVVCPLIKYQNAGVDIYTGVTLGVENIIPNVKEISIEGSSESSFTVTGENLSENVTIKVNSGGFLLSGDNGQNWYNQIEITTIPNFDNKTIKVKYQGSGDLNGSIKLSSKYAPTKTINLTCSALPELTLTPSAINMLDNEEKDFRASGSNLTGDVSVTVTDDFEIKTEGGLNWASSATIPAANVNTGINLLVRIKPGKPIDIYNGTITATADYVSPSPTISVSGTVSDNWWNAVLSEPSGYLADDINSADDLAWFAKQGGGNGTLTADINMAAHPWKPIANHTGTFNGNGHVITGLTNKISGAATTEPGLFATVNGGTVKNVFVKSCDFEGLKANNYYGIIANTMTGGTVTGCEVNGTVGDSGKWGGVVGQVTGGTVSSCISMVAPTGGGSLVYEGAVSNSYATAAGNLVQSGTVTCCYNRVARSLVNGSSTTGFSEPTFGYGGKGCASNDGIRIIDKMNTASASVWAQPVTTSINNGYPVLKLEDFNTMVQDADGFIHYGDLANFVVSGSNTMLFYGKKDNMATAYEGNNLYIDEDAALKLASGVTVNAHTSRFIKNLSSREEREVWHHYASPVTGQSLGINYTTNDQCTWDQSCGPKLVGTGGFFPYLAGTDGNGWDLYCFHEPAYHWINFKRNSNSHWYSENHTKKIDYTNEATLNPGKGYLVAMSQSGYVQATGNLNHGDDEHPISIQVNVSELSTTPGAELSGFNLIGNPFQSYLKFSEFASANSGTDDNKIWTGSDKATYLIYSPKYDCYSQGSVATPSKDSQAASDYISMHQGFFIVSDKPCGSVENPTVVYTATFTDAMCSVEPSSSDAPFRGEDYAYPLINLMVRDSEGVGDLAVVEFDRPEFAAAPKLFNYGGRGKVYFSYENEDDALLFLSEAIDQLPVHFDALEDAEYTLNWSTANADFSYLHLIDNITGADIDMLAHDSYSFSATTADYKSRFKLKFAYTGIGENEDTVLAEVFAFLHDGNLIVNGQGIIDIIDMNGRTICNQKLTGEQNTVGLPNVAPGIYVVRLVNNSETKVQKIIVNK